MRALVKLTFDDHITPIQQESQRTHTHSCMHMWLTHIPHLVRNHIKYVIIIVAFFLSLSFSRRSFELLLSIARNLERAISNELEFIFKL